jgi:type IV pilus assembly protein PilV
MLMSAKFKTIQQPKRYQSGSLMLEGLVAILIFSLGILGLMGLQAASIRLSDGAKSRSDAAFLANKIISQMWLQDSTTLSANFGFNAATVNDCSVGAAAAPAALTGWLTNDVATTLPGASAGYQKIAVGAGNNVTVTLCWKAPSETDWHRYTTTSRICKNTAAGC